MTEATCIDCGATLSRGGRLRCHKCAAPIRGAAVSARAAAKTEAFLDQVAMMLGDGMSPEDICTDLDVAPAAINQRARRVGRVEIARPFGALHARQLNKARREERDDDRP